MLFALALAAAAAARLLYNDEDLALLRAANPPWPIALSPRFEGVTLEEARAMLINPDLDAPPAPRSLGSFLDRRIRDISRRELLADVELPEEFDVHKAFFECDTHEVWDQGNCGSCYAFSATHSFGVRRCVAGKEDHFVHYSEQDIVSCSSNAGCNGGFMDATWAYLFDKGVPTNECVSYKSADGKNVACARQCDDGSELVRVHTVDAGRAVPSPEEIQRELVRYGPVQTGYVVYLDFYYFAPGAVYQHFWGPESGRHAVSITGYGVEEGTGTKYWIVRNSWGPSWGENGYFKIVRGINDCDIESYAYVGYFDEE